MRKKNDGTSAKYIDPFRPLAQAARDTTGWLQKSQAADVASAQFAEGMGLKRDVFAERQSQNDIANANAAARLGLARGAAARAGNALTWQQKRQYMEREDARRKDNDTYYKSRPSSSKSGKYGGSTIPSDVSKNMKPNDLAALRQMETNMYADGSTKADVAAATAARTEAVSGLNMFNYNDYGLEDKWF